jgi:hypothetical protein
MELRVRMGLILSVSNRHEEGQSTREERDQVVGPIISASDRI